MFWNQYEFSLIVSREKKGNLRIQSCSLQFMKKQTSIYERVKFSNHCKFYFLILTERLGGTGRDCDEEQGGTCPQKQPGECPAEKPWKAPPDTSECRLLLHASCQHCNESILSQRSILVQFLLSSKHETTINFFVLKRTQSLYHECRWLHWIDIFIQLFRFYNGLTVQILSLIKKIDNLRFSSQTII